MDELCGKITGSISKVYHVSGAIGVLQAVTGTITLRWDSSYVPPYTGEYTVTPRARQQVVLDTQGKRMSEDVTVLKVPYYETGNLYGDTVYIAMEV